MAYKPISIIMTTSPVVANPFNNFSQVLRLFTEFPIHHLPIVDVNNKLIGIVSSNDLPKVFLQLSKKDPKISLDLDVIDREINLPDIMTPNPITVSSTDTIDVVAKIFAAKKFLALPVVDNGILVGIVSLKDVVSIMIE
ncbi:MAG: CBS domain-containing protein [Chitinophagales bacterium]